MVKEKETLMEALEKAGYPREEMFNHCSDLLRHTVDKESR